MADSSESVVPRTLTARLLGGLVSLASARPRLTLWIMLLLACASVGYTVANLTIRTSRFSLSDQSSPASKTWDTYVRKFGASPDVVVVVETSQANKRLIEQVLNDLGKRLDREPELFQGVLYQIDQRSLRRKGLQFLSTEELRKTASRVTGFEPVVRNQQWDLLRPENLASNLRARIESAEKSGPAPESLYRSADQFSQSLNRFVQQSVTGGRVEGATFQSPLPPLLTVAAEKNMSDSDVAYMTNADGNLGMIQLFVVPQSGDFDENSRSLARLREISGDVADHYRKIAPDLTVTLSGIPVLEHDEMRRTSADILNASLIAMVIVSFLLLFGFRGLKHPMLALLTLVVGLCWTFAAATFAVGHLNILSIAFTVILIGLGVDFSIHFLTRYLSLRQELYELKDALRLTGESAGTGIVTSALTTALAFGSAVFSGFPGLAELGIISGIGVLLCSAATFLFLPALIALSDAELDVEKLPQPLSHGFYRRVLVSWPLIVIGVGILAIAGVGSRAFWYSDGSIDSRVAWDANLLKVHDQDQPSVKVQKRLFDSANESLLYSVAIADTYEHALTLRNQLVRLPSVGRVSEVASLIPPRPDNSQQAAIRDLYNQVASVPRSNPNFRSADHIRVGREVERLYALLKKSPNHTARDAAAQLDQFLTSLEQLSGPQAIDILNAFQLLTARSVINEHAKVVNATSMEEVTFRDVPDALQSRYVRADQDKRQYWLLRIYPKQDIWEPVALAAFVKDVQSVVPKAGGIPVENFDSSQKMIASYQTQGLYAIAVIGLVILFDFLRPGQKLLTILPPIAVTGFIGYTYFQRTGAVHPTYLVLIALGLVAFIAAVVDYRNLRDTIIALMPAVLGGILLMGFMAIAGLSFNPVNLIVLNLLLGIGVDNGILLLHDYRRQIARGQNEYSPSADTVNGILMTSLTSIIGFGSLMIASHNGLFSVGVLLSIGIAGCLFVSLAVLPALLVIVAKYQPTVLEPIRLRAPKSETGDAAATQKQAPAKAKKAA
ncbi:MAG: MMPL family transporter [Planctomyces sp.]|nr:MMPL family transporter [Planctomyces sp.]